MREAPIGSGKDGPEMVLGTPSAVVSRRNPGSDGKPLGEPTIAATLRLFSVTVDLDLVTHL